MARLTEQEREGMDAELAAIPDWGGAGPWLNRFGSISPRNVVTKGRRYISRLRAPASTPPLRPKPPTPTGDDDADIDARVVFDNTVWRPYLRELNEYNSSAISEAAFGDLIDWNGAKWMFVGLDPATEEIWLAPMAGVKRRPEVVEPGEPPRQIVMTVSSADGGEVPE